jgi:phthalate 4,5-cis-dihydrodiol dehydrogenase
MAGLGIGASQVIPGLAKMPEVELVAAADVRPQALDAFQAQFGARVYTSVEALCDDPDVDVVWVATPNQMHCEHVVMAAERGKHVVCEKPMALSVEQAQRMVETAERRGVKMVCGHTYSLHPSIQEMRRIVRSGELGRLIQVAAWLYTDWLIKPRMPEEIDVSLGGGVVYRHGPHLIDSIRVLGGGMVRSVRAMTGQWLPERPAPGNYVAYLEFEDGTPATIAYSGYGYFYTSELTWGIGSRLYSDEESVRVRQGLRRRDIDVEAEKEAMRFGAQRPAAGAGSASSSSGVALDRGWFGLILASCERGDIRQSPTGLLVYGDEGKREVPVPRTRTTGNAELRELYDAVHFGTPIAHHGRWGMATLEVCLAIMQSGRERREIMLAHQSPSLDVAPPTA